MAKKWTLCALLFAGLRGSAVNNSLLCLERFAPCAMRHALCCVQVGEKFAGKNLEEDEPKSFIQIFAPTFCPLLPFTVEIKFRPPPNFRLL